jgi:2-iminoacetate synthase ThiH
MIAIARPFMDDIAHIQGSWPTTGKEVGQLSPHYGADDLGSWRGTSSPQPVPSTAPTGWRSST